MDSVFVFSPLLLMRSRKIQKPFSSVHQIQLEYRQELDLQLHCIARGIRVLTVVILIVYNRVLA